MRIFKYFYRSIYDFVVFIYYFNNIHFYIDIIVLFFFLLYKKIEFFSFQNFFL